MRTFISLLSVLLVSVSAMELSADTWDDLTVGKAVFLKFFAPWCGHCKKMKPAWDQLMEIYEDSTSFLVAEVDCTAEGKELCSEFGVRGYPTIKWGDPDDLQDYRGGRDFASLKKFAEDNLKAVCGPSNPDNCDAAEKEKLVAYQALSDSELESTLSKAQQELSDATDEHEETIEKLNERFAVFKKEKVSEIGILKAIKAGKSSKDEL